MVKIVAIVQARMGSVRCPRKVLRPVGGVPLIQLLLNRLNRSKLISKIVLATSEDESNDELVETVKAIGYDVFRGDENDVLDRYYQAAKEHDADVVVRITGDCPLIDPEVVDQVIRKLCDSGLDYVSNIAPPTFPDGLDAEAFRMSALETAWQQAREPADREHVTLFIRGNGEFQQGVFSNPIDYSNIRWTVDEEADFEPIINVVNHFGANHFFRWKQVIELMEQKPEFFESNQDLARNQGTKMGTGQKLWQRAKAIIPGGSQLLSKRTEMYHPSNWPAYYQKAHGSHVWDLDGQEYVDMCFNGIGTCVLGAADPDVNLAVQQAVESGSMSTLNCPEEVELAEMLCELHPWASRVRFSRTGGEALSIAVRIARAFSGKEKVAFCGYHGWHDWYLAANLVGDSGLDGHLLPGLTPNGVPRGLVGSSLPFRYNQISELRQIFERSAGDIGVVVMEPIRSQKPENGFLESVRKICDEAGAVLIFDEVTSAFRMNCGGAHLVLSDVRPDIAVFGKAISNGYAMGAVIGRDDVMEAAQDSFISSTYWTERIGPAAALATIRKFRDNLVHEKLIENGRRVQNIWLESASHCGLPVHVGGLEPLSHFSFETSDPNAAKTLFVQLMLERGFLASTAFYATFAHSDEDFQNYQVACLDVFATIQEQEENGTLEDMIEGGHAHTGFARLT